jgi:hypothetical protein
MRNRRNTYKRRKTRRGTKRKQRRIFSRRVRSSLQGTPRRVRKQRKQSGGGIPNDNITKALRGGDIVTTTYNDPDGYSNAPVMETFSDYQKGVSNTV